MLTVLYPDEQFKPFRKKFLVSNYGRVYSVVSDKFLKILYNKDGYCRFEEYFSNENGKRKRQFWFVHITVVNLFGDCYGKRQVEGLEIDHVNGDKSDNRISNLELVTHSENCKRWHRLKAIEAFQIDQELFGLS